MDPAEHEKRIDWLFSRIKEAVLSADFSDEPGPWNRAQPGQLGRIVRDLCDDALADAYGSGELDERKAVVSYCRGRRYELYDAGQEIAADIEAKEHHPNPED